MGSDQGEFDTEKLPRRVDGKTGCARCHIQTSFRTFPNGFDHGRWTGFRVEGAHEKAGCSACHAALQKPDEHGRTWGRARGNRCADCHQDPHAGQFNRNGRTDCMRCHKNAAAFARLTFRHNLDSVFPIEDNHKGLACGACHKKEKIGGIDVIRYRPLGRNCTDCHADQKNPFGRKGKKK